MESAKSRACVLACLCASVLACLSASVLGVLACVRACCDKMFYFLTCLRTWCAFFLFTLHFNI